MKEFGGYFELELNDYEHFHKNALKLNSARNCFELILKQKRISKLYIPFYTCKSILEPVIKLNIDYEFYHINNDFEIVSCPNLEDNERILYTNYYGLKSIYIKTLADKFKDKLIVDNSQAFFDLPIENIDTFYSPRKFFGVPDGGYCYVQTNKEIKFKQDFSEDRIYPHIHRIEKDASSGLELFREKEKGIANQPIRKMSALTDRLLANIDYKRVIMKRKKNYLFLSNEFDSINLLSSKYHQNSVPMIYPLYIDNYSLRDKLINNHIYIPTYWPNVLEWCDNSDTEYKFAQNLIALPIDQRYTLKDMKKITSIVKNLL